MAIFMSFEDNGFRSLKNLLGAIKCLYCGKGFKQKHKYID